MFFGYEVDLTNASGDGGLMLIVCRELRGGDCRFWIHGHLELVFSQKGLHGRGTFSAELFSLFHACDKAKRDISSNRNLGIMTSSMHLSSDRPKIRTNHNAWVIQLII